jgi:hypothetical protein
LDDQRALTDFIVIDAVEQEVIVEAGQAIHCNLNPRPIVVRRTTKGTIVLRTLIGSGTQPGQLNEISAIQR